MLLTRAAGLPAAGDASVAVEVKHDGIRAQVRVDRAGHVTVRTRHGRDCTDHFPELAAIAEHLAGRQATVDGELTVLDDDGRPDFMAVMARRTQLPRRAAADPRLRLHVFDIVHLDGDDLSPLPYLDRRAALQELGLEGPQWTTTPYFVGQATEVFATVRAMELEGVVLKPVDGRYRPGKRGPWAKYKATRLNERLALRAVPATERDPAGFLVARRDDHGRLDAHQVVRHGLTARERARLRRLLSGERPVAVRVRAHGRPDGVLRDAVLDSIAA